MSPIPIRKGSILGLKQARRRDRDAVGNLLPARGVQILLRRHVKPARLPVVGLESLLGILT